MTFPQPGTSGPPPTTTTPLDSGRIITELTGTDITLGNVVIEDPATGTPIGATNGGLQTYLTGPSPLPVTLATPNPIYYLAAGTVASLTAAGGTASLPAALATTRVTVVSFGILPTAALSGIPALRVQLEANGGLVLASGVVRGDAPWVVTLPTGALVGTAGALSIVYGANSGSLELDYTVAGVSP